MSKRTISSFVYFGIIALSLWTENILCDYEKQPKVVAKNGDLVVEAAYDRNITLRLIGDSSLFLNNVDVMDKLRERSTSPAIADGDSKQTEIFSVDKIKMEIEKLRYDLQPFARTLLAMQRRTSRSLQLSVIRRNLGRISRLSGRLVVLERRLKKDECAEATGPCKNGGTCYDSYNAFICECTEGYTGKTCEDDVDECYLLSGTDLGCQNNAVCINTPGSYKCICAKGFSGTHCRLRNTVCNQNQYQELCGHGTCVPANNDQGYSCICDQGWKRNTSATPGSSIPTTLACDVDVNECEESSNPCHSECINLPGSFKCGPCPAGYTGNGVTCFDVDECATNNGGCSTLPKVRCINTEGSYICASCPTGWVGDGHTCELAPSNSCNEENICHPQANCEYISDVASCTCPPGMFGHGFGPRGCHTNPLTDSCTNHICQNNGTCVSSGRTTTCICRSGYTGALCEIADGCHPNPCQNDGNCKPLGVNGFKCSCLPGTTGKHCEVLRSVCAKTMRRPAGNLKYPNDDALEYSINERCAWIIRTDAIQILNVTFSKFDVEESEDCTRDFLQIHDGNSLASQLIGRFCGNDLPLGGNILSSHNLLFFWFRSDNVTNRAGFEMSWVSQAHVCGENLDLSYKDAGVVKSPGYPGKMPTNRECQWKLSAPYGYRFVIRIYDVNLGSTANCTGDSFEINDDDLVLKKYCQFSSSEVLRSSSNKVSMHLHTDRLGVDSSFQLHYEVEPGQPHCGGLFTEPSGYILGPSVQATCLYLIQQPPGTQIKWEFLDFISSGVINCNFNKIEIFDGKTDESPRIIISCGEKIQETVISTNNYMLVRYKNILADEADKPIKAKYSRVCDFRVFGPDSGILSTPNYPKPYVEHITCTFRIYGPADTVIVANFTDFSIAETVTSTLMDPEYSYSGNSSNSLIEMNKLNDDSITYVDIFLSSTNKRRFLKGAPMVLRSERNEMKLVFHATTNSVKARGIRLEYSFEEIDCGGVYTQDKGSLDKTVNDDECILIFEAPPGKHIRLDFDFMVFAGRGGEILIYANQTGGGGDFLLKNATRSSKIQETFNFNTITLLLKTRVKILGQYEFVNTAQACGGNFTTLYGAITSPSWPRSYQSNLDCVWIITASLGNKIELQVHNFTLEPTCSGDILEIRNGKFANSPLIGRYCASRIPARLVSFTNSLYIRFTTDNYIEGAGFYLNWEQTMTGCGGKLTAYKGSIHTPHFDTLPEVMTMSDVNMICDWKIVVAQGSSIELNVTTAMDELEFCHKNNLRIYDGSTNLSPLLEFNCSSIIKGGHMKLKSTSNQLLIIYSLTENSKSMIPDFILDYVTNCRAVIDQYRGVIESPNFPENYPENQNCAWDVKAGRNNKLILQFSHLSLEVSDLTCEYDYVELWDMQDMDILKKHHICTYTPDPIISEGNRFMIHFVTDYSTNKNGFRAEFNRVGCGQHMVKDFGYISSPNSPFSNDLDCDWFIEVEPGRQIVLVVMDFHIESESPDCSQNMLYVKESKNSSIELAKECREQQIPLTVTSPANRLLIHFHTSPTRSRKYFKASYHTKQSTCGGSLRGTSGTISSPSYSYTTTTKSYNCVWDVTVPESYGILLNFQQFKIPDSPNCTEDSVEFFKVDGGSSQFLDRFCGEETPNIKLVHGNHLRVVYKTSGQPASFGTFSIVYKKECGSLITKSNGYIKSLASEECIWEFDVPQGTLISLTILQMDCYCQKNDDGVKMCKHGLGFKENHFDNNLQTGNYTMYMCEQHQTDLVFEASKLHIFANNINFRAKYSTTQHSCGGTIESSSGSLASPYYPATYPPNSDCNWILEGSKGSFLELRFDKLDIVNSEHCNEDYLEIRNWSEGNVLGIYCGSKIPEAPLVSYERFWLRFHSSGLSTAKGFKLSWNYAHLNELLNMTQGSIANPPLNMVKNDDESYAWRIVVPRGKFIQLNFDEYNSGLSLFDGFDQTALLLKIMPSPWRFVSSSNVVYLQTENDEIEMFTVLWSTVSNKPLDANATLSKCHSEEFIKVHRYNAIRVFSPGYPKGYENGITCNWIFKPANSIEHVAVALLQVDLENTAGCSSDYLQISTSANLLSWHKQEQLCNESNVHKSPFLWIHGTPHIKLDFVTDWSINGTGFLAKVVAKCGSNMTDSVGFIDGSMFNDFNDGPNTKCVWHVNVKAGKRINVRIDYPNVPLNKYDFDDECSNHALLYDGVDDHAPLIMPGKLCFPQKVTSILVNSSSNHLTIKYVLNLNKITPKLINMNFWNLTYREYSECNEEIRLIPEAAAINITSPLYPNVPHPHTECVWRITAPPGEIIQLEFIERFDMNSRYCSQEYLEFFDGSTSLSRNLGRYCTKPPMIRTTQNMLFVHYLTDIAEPRNGFKALISINRCGGTFTQTYGSIKSPGYPASYPSGAQCDFVISLRGQRTIRLSFADVNLPYNATNLQSSDHLEIITISNDANITFPSILIYGNNTKPSEFQIASNRVIVRFHTFAKTLNFRGFLLKYYVEDSFCENFISGISGDILMNLIAKPLYQRTCTWQITVPKNQRVRLEFLNMDDLKDYNFTTPLRFNIYNSFDSSFQITTFNPKTFNSQAVIQSSDNLMQIRVVIPRTHVTLRPLKARYSSDDESPCPHDIDGDNNSGTIEIPGLHSIFNGTFYCGIKIKPNEGETVVFNISRLLVSFQGIAGSQSPLMFGDSSMTSYRKNLTNYIHAQSQRNSFLKISQNTLSRIESLKMSYRIYSCGGLTSAENGFQINYPQINTIAAGGEIFCLWTLYKPYFGSLDYKTKQYKLIGNFSFTESCDNEYIEIVEGQWTNRSSALKICRDKMIDDFEYLLTKRYNFIVYKSITYNSEKSAFALSIENSLSCSSETLVNYILSPIKIDKSSYKNNQECSWIFESKTGLYLQLHFLGRFFIQDSVNCTKDYLEIQRDNGGIWIPEARFCGREVPELYNSTSNRIQIIFRTDDTITTDGFEFVVQTHCGLVVNVTSTQPQIITSPVNNPMNWRKLYCEYIFQGNETDKLIVVKTRFITNTSLLVFPGNSCRLGSLKVNKRNDNGTDMPSEQHCELEFEERAYKYLRFIYDAYSGRKFTMEYAYDSCGGNLTTPAVIRPLKHKSENTYAENMNCIWFIAAPSEHSIAVKFKYFSTEETYDHLTIYSGFAIKQEKLVARLSGNYSSTVPIVVDSNQAVINAISDSTGSSRGFEANIIFLANCNERISLTEGNSPVTLARNIKFNSSEEYICTYRITAPKSYRIRIDIKKLQINSANSTCLNSYTTCDATCNILEIYDSSATFETISSKFCSSSSINTTFVSSFEFVSMRLTASHVGQYSFEIILKMEKTECGPSEYRLGINEKFKFTFPPNGLSKYGSNIHCNWRFISNKELEYHFNYIDLQNKSQTTGKCLDYITIKDVYYVNHLCGKSENFTINTLSMFEKNAGITFHSDDSEEGKGFEFVVQRSDACNRTYNFLSKTVSYRTNGWDTVACNDTIIVPENFTLNFYINTMYFKNYDCTKLHLKITDLKTNNTLLERCQNTYTNVNLFTTTNAVRVEASDFTYIDFAYAASSRSLPPGCGGTFRLHKAQFSSPSYENDRNYSECRYDIIIPTTNDKTIQFIDFNMGTITNCHLDNVKVIEILSNKTEKLLKTLCGPDLPEAIVSNSDHLVIISKKSPNFDGTGWTLSYDSSNYEKNSRIFINNNQE